MNLIWGACADISYVIERPLAMFESVPLAMFEGFRDKLDSRTAPSRTAPLLMILYNPLLSLPNTTRFLSTRCSLNMLCRHSQEMRLSPL